MEHLAKIVGLSPAYFSFIFKQETGYSPREYITNIRMSKAKLLLIQTNKSITEIAFEVGYASNASFTNLFTDKVGCSPKTFRKLMR
ncbi:MAG: helix-turn-helix domain-containing protein [Ruminococcus sp.]|jgi:AraC family transcriptional regulator